MTPLHESLQIFAKTENISPDLFREVLSGIVEGNYNDIEIAGFLMGFSAYQLSAAHLSEAVTLLREKMITVKAPEDAVDCCGTGGDADKIGGSLNISTAVAFLGAKAGLYVAKHGNRSVSSRSGSADVLEALGYHIESDPELLSQQLYTEKLAFLFAPYFHPALKNVSTVRKTLKIRTFFNLLGPMLNPASVKYQLIGIYDFSLAPIMAQVLRDTGTKRALIVQSAEGADEFTLSGANKYLLLEEDGSLQSGTLSPEDVGLTSYAPNILKGGDAAYNAKALKALLDGQQGPYRDVVNLNCGALLYVAGKAKSFQDGVDIAKDIRADPKL
ncbi:MAG: anthranilate phosphoribosyltransferase [Pseudomonadota bacterium]